MSYTMPIEQAAAKLAELVGKMSPGDEIVLTSENLPVARIIPSTAKSPRRQPGNCKGMLVVNQEDDDHLRDFSEYMQ